MGVGREAPRRELRDPRAANAASPPPTGATIVHGGRARVPAGDAARGATWARSTPGTTTWTSSRSWSWVRTEVAAKRLGKKEAKQAAKDVAKARTRDHMRVFAKRADEIDGKLRIVADPPLIVPIDDLVHDGPSIPATTRNVLMRSLIQTYRRSLADHHHPIEEFEYVHTARKVVGVGSVGTRAWIHLFVGRDEHDPLFLQSKEAQASVLERFVGKSEHNEPRPASRRRPAPDAGGQRHLPRLDPRQGPRRRRCATTTSASSTTGRAAPTSRRLLVPGATLYARLCGATLARAHARWGDRIAIASYLGDGRRVRPRDRRLLRRVRRPERARLRGVRSRGRQSRAGSRRRPACSEGGSQADLGAATCPGLIRRPARREHACRSRRTRSSRPRTASSRRR